MSDELRELLKWCENVKMTEEELAAQRRSFVYGNVKIDNDAVTEEMVTEVGAALYKK